MPEIAEDEEMMREEEARLLEEERQRLLEEALAQQQIQDAPAAPEMPVIFDPEPAPEIPVRLPPAEPGYSKDSERYAQEVARAQRGSGFINADIGPTGNVITAGYDPERDPVAMKAAREATALQRDAYYNSLLQGGATPAEAYSAASRRYPQSRRTSDDFLKTAALMEKTRPKPLVTEVRDGVTYILGPQGWRAAPRIAPPVQPKITPGKVPDTVKTQVGLLEKEIAAEIARLSKGTKTAIGTNLKPQSVPLTEAEVAAGQQKIARLKNDILNLYGPEGRLRPEYNAKVDQPGWEAMRDRFNTESSPQMPAIAAAKPKGKEVVRYTADGKKAVFDAETKKLLRIE